jgi:hypothetical protein
VTPLAIVLLAVAVLGISRTLWWQYKSPAPAKLWRLALLCGLQLLVAALLWRTLEPPFRSGDAGTLVVATAGAPRLAALAVGDALVALPEAPALPGVARVPDLATALRRHPGTTGLRIIGEGLQRRDQIATGLPLAFDPVPLPRGLVALTAPPTVAPGAPFRVGGSVHDVPGGRVDLLDPAGRAVAGTPLAASGDFALSATARAAGPAEFSLRITDRGGRRVETAIVPVVATEVVQPRLLIVAGAAGPDLKYLRRWAADAGIAIGSSIAAGNGLDLGDAPPRLDAANLVRLDLLVLDERSWAALTMGERARVLAAVQAGLGLVLRVTGPLPDATRREWAALGFALDDATRPVRLPGNAVPLTRLAAGPARADAAPLLRDATGNPVGHWRALGRGRMGLWPVTDLYTLVLSDGERNHAAIWSEIFATLARPQPLSPPRISDDASPGQRVAICNLGPAASVRHPDGAVTNLVVDAGCAGFWPRITGWHELRAPAVTPFLVTSIGAGRTAAQARNATLDLVSPGGSSRAAVQVRGASWPWFIAWALAAALLWWFERSRIGRATAAEARAG